MSSNADPLVTRLRAYITEHQLEPGMRLPPSGSSLRSLASRAPRCVKPYNS